MNTLRTRSSNPRRALAGASLIALLVVAPIRAYAGEGARTRPASSPHSSSQTAVKSKLRAGARSWWRRRWVLPAAGAAAFLAAMRIHEGSSHGPFGIDYRLKAQDNNGIF